MKGFLTSDGKYSDDQEIASFMEAASGARKFVKTGEIASVVHNAVSRLGGNQDTLERMIMREVLRNADRLVMVLRPIAKRVKANREALARLSAQVEEESVASSQQRDLLNTDTLINKYL